LGVIQDMYLNDTHKGREVFSEVRRTRKGGRDTCAPTHREPQNSLGRYGREDVVAGTLAATASLSAHPAVLVVGSVLLALIPAKAASFGTGLERRPRHLRLEGRLTGKDPARSVAHVGAVEVKADTAGQRLGVVLAEASVGASCTALSAVVAGFYTLD
jgi:hypothetical protein